MYIKSFVILTALSTLFYLGCKEEMVGAPCKPEIDNGNFNISIQGETWSIETSSVQCETRICVTQIRPNPNAPSEVIEDCQNKQDIDHCWTNDGKNVHEPYQLKFSFCSCRCADAEGNTYNTNPDKYDYLCECPPSTKCVEVLKPMKGISDKIPGSYCVPGCIAEPCPKVQDKDTEDNVYPRPQICSPSKDSKEPWKWQCLDVPEAIQEKN
jgi:hypothetical protein